MFYFLFGPLVDYNGCTTTKKYLRHRFIWIKFGSAIVIFHNKKKIEKDSSISLFFKNFNKFQFFISKMQKFTSESMLCFMAETA